MSQETNLNVAPYFDDFDANNDYYKVLFKPGYPVQARELTTLQSILQNQIERFGQHFFKEGSKVIPGNTTYNKEYYAVQIDNAFLGIPISDYISQILGAKITGQVSGVTAIVNKIILANESERGNTTLYVNYLSSNSQDNLSGLFLDGESLEVNATIASANTIIAVGEPFATTIADSATAIGSAFSISNGIYFAKGQFLGVSDETILLDQYDNSPNYRIGLLINEEIVNSDIDNSLNDNSKGFNNYSAPGADRLKITASLFKKELDDFDDNNFVELATVTNGRLRSKKNTTDYNIIADELARRTYAESGDYYVTPFDVSLKNSLNDGIGNRGIFNLNQQTYGGSSPSDDLALYQISPGRAFVKGYDVETIGTSYLDVLKPRTTKVLNNQSINYSTGATLKLNRVHGAPTIGIGNTYVLSLRDSRVGSNQTASAGKEIGLARVYDFNLESGSYTLSNLDINQWKISLFDVQTFTEISLNEPITLSTPTFVEGKHSGASAFISTSVTSSASLTLYDTKGDFVKNEPFIFNGVENSRVAIAVTSFGISDVKSVSHIVGSASTFTADTIQTELLNIGVSTISGFSGSGGISTISSINPQFPGQLKAKNLLKFSNQTSPDPVFAEVVSVGSSVVTVTGIQTVTGVVDGDLPANQLAISNLAVISTNLEGTDDDSFFTELPKQNIYEVDLTDASLSIRKSFDVTISSGQLSSAVSAGTNESFLPFTNSRYELIKKDGTIEALTTDKVDISADGSQIQIYNLSSGNDDATLIATLKKLKPKSKVKLQNRVSSLIVDKSKSTSSGIGTTTLNDGLTYDNYAYGTRVQDSKISLNEPDIITIHGIYESVNTSDPSAPKVTLSSISGPTGRTSDIVIGEMMKGQSSGAMAICAERLTDSQISFIHKNNKNFKEGEVITFEESNIVASITTIETPSINISTRYTFDNGQKESFYDYGFLTRKSDAKEPNRKLRVYFASGYYESTDDGDITTAQSYNSFDYDTEVQTVNNIRNTDIIDIRPRVSSYTSFVGGRSPFEFHGRTFTGSGDSAANILASDETIVTNYSFYLGRIDRVYLTPTGKFQVKYGTPAEAPQLPSQIDDALEIATINLPPYLYDVSDASIRFLDHKRFKMSDIKRLENRIKTLEYYTSLSLLEMSTSNLFVPDSSGVNRFKSGFFVDNFTSFLAQETSIELKNSVDLNNQEIRPKHYTNSVDLIFGPTGSIASGEDIAFVTPEGNNISKTGDIITLDYSEIEWLRQTFATRTESVTPFLISFWSGNMEMSPPSDNWVDTVSVEARVINTEGNFAQTIAEASRTLNVDPQTGFAPTIWNSWQTNWTGEESSAARSTRDVRQRRGNNGTFTETIQNTFTDTVERGVESRTGTRTAVIEQFDRTSQGNRVVSRDLISFMRSRNIQFNAEAVKPQTQVYPFFDGVDVSAFCVPKLLEIAMISGSFQVGETVVGRTRPIGVLPLDTRNVDASITFRVAATNHKEGPFNSPSRRYTTNPYDRQQLSGSYSSTSSILNIDTFSLSNQPEGTFSGYVETGMILVGQTSGAQATVTNLRLISDISGTIQGSFFIPNPNNTSNPRFETGDKVFTLINNVDNDPNSATSIAQEGFISAGTLETTQETIVSVRNARVDRVSAIQERDVARVTGTEILDTQVIASSFQADQNNDDRDPLSQSFLVDEDSGVFITKCDVFFETRDENDIPITMQIRTMENGLPTTRVLPFSEVNLTPSEVNVSADGSVATTFDFRAPVYLEGGREYCVTLLSSSTQYNVFISRVGEVDFITQTFISNQPYLGSLFKSQNGSTWEPSQWEDLKFTLYRADFVETGSVEFYSPELTEGNRGIAQLMPNSLNLNSKEVRIGIGSTLQDTVLTFGNTITQLGTDGSGKYVANAGVATDTLRIINAGIGYTPGVGHSTFNNVPLTTITGNGRDARAEVTVRNGIAIGATIVSSGKGYVQGDVLGIGTIGNNSLGLGARLSVVSIAQTSQFVLHNVQGDFSITGVGNTLQFVNNSGVTTDVNAAQGGNVLVNEIITNNDGLHIQVNHKNHGMYFDENFVTISDVQTDIIPTRLSEAYDSSSTSPLVVDSISNLTLFENVGVGTTNAGYVLIGDEIISYEDTTSTTLAGTITRGVDSTTSRNYPVGTPVFKYELGGVSLRRINKTHNLESVTVANPIGFDSYNIKLDMGAAGTGRTTSDGYPSLFVGETKFAGGDSIKATQNIPYEIITPLVQNLNVQGTSVDAEVRTVSSRSLSGSETPYVDRGFEPITLNEPNYLENARLIASRVNETNKITSISGNKSMNLRVNLNSTDSRVSPVIDTQRVSAIFTSNRVNDIVTNYITDSRVNSLLDDPTAFQYISKEITLENPASSLKIIVDAHVNIHSNIRAFYSISESSNFEPIFVPFPGYNNINDRGEIIDVADSDGLPDTFIAPSKLIGFRDNDVDYKEYSFTIDELPSFKSYRIKLIMTSTNQAHVPRMKDLRVISLA